MTMSLVLLVFLGLIKLVFVGYEQAEADGAAFVAAHAASLMQTGQSARGVQVAYTAFPSFPSSSAESISVAAAPTSGEPNRGDVVGIAKRSAGGLFYAQTFTGQIGLHSTIVEPVVSTPNPGGVNLVIVQAKPPSCDINNYATNASTAWECNSVALATPDPSATDPYHAYACHLAYMASLTSGQNWIPGPPLTTAPDLSDIEKLYGPAGTGSFGKLTNGAGQTLTQQPWPDEYQGTSSGSINDYNEQNVRGSGVFLTNQSNPQNPGGGATGGLIGTQLQPIFKFGLTGDKCAT